MSGSFQSLVRATKSERRVRTVGLTGAARAWVLSRLLREQQRPLVCVTADEDAADLLADDLTFFLGSSGVPPPVLRLPADEVLPWDELVPQQSIVSDRLTALFHLCHARPIRVVVLSVRALSKKVMPVEVMRGLSQRIVVGEDHARDGLARALAGMGFRNSPLVEDPGSFSVRGDIVDVFPPLHEQPVRLEFFGDTVESMRTFDAGTQRTIEQIRELNLLPAREMFFNDETKKSAEAAIRAAAELQNVPTSKVRERLEQVKESVSAAGLEGLLPGFFKGGLQSVFEYLKCWHADPLLWLDEPAAQERALEELHVDIEQSFGDAVRRQELTLGADAHFVGREELRQLLTGYRVIEGGGLSFDSGEPAPLSFSFESTEALRQQIREHHGEEGALAPLIEKLQQWSDARIYAAVSCGSAGQVDRLKRLLLERKVKLEAHTNPFVEAERTADPKVQVHLFADELSHGFVDPESRLAVLSAEDIFGSKPRRKTRRRTVEGFSASFKDLKEGDLCVHADFGICRYAGLITITVDNISGDFLVLEFAGRDKVYLPVSRMRLISRFTGGDSSAIALDKLGAGTWEKKKAQVKENLLKMAAELLQLYAERKAHPGHAFSSPDRYFRQFEADFEFEETPDQQKAIDDVLADMQRTLPMDRLICGDVGYGKTEVAMRAVFKAVLDRKQVAVLTPTTLLAHQHFATFKKRFAGYPVTVEVVSGLKKPSEVRDIVQRAREGRLDVLIGTHKLLNSEIGFRDLGLYVIDEEQKFGVKQKEALKRLRTTVDTLTLSATPIPRTLNMAMSGMRDLSLITTPPVDRRAIRTFVNKFDERQIREAVMREIQRGGQVFFIHNRVETIHSMEQLLRKLLPEVTMGVAHGQMGEGQLEKVMFDFVERRLQLLLCTSIVESGIDISTANTMIVDRADQFGLSQLYQLRGRVGRSKERAYAYLLVPPGRAVTKEAERRLEVLQAFTELGAGFTIASHDLELRGAGSLLGKEQSGSIEAVGFDMYAQMLEEAIAEVRGDAPRREIEPDINLPLPAYLPEHWVPDVQQRLILYKRFTQCQTPDEVIDLRSELIDRFGDAPDEVDNLQEVMLLKLELRALQLRQLDGSAGRLVVTLGPDARLDGGKLATLVQKSKGLYRLTPDLKLIARLDGQVKGAEFIAAARKVLRDVHACATNRR